MGPEIKRYLIVDVKNIEKQQWLVKREAMFNDFEHIYYPKGNISATQYFYGSNIPEEFQKIIICVSGSLFRSKKDMEEFTTGHNLIIANQKSKRVDKSKVICVRTRIYDGISFVDDMYFETPLRYISYEEVVEFYKKIGEAKCMERYLDVVNQMFSLRADVKLTSENVVNDSRESQVLGYQKRIKIVDKK